MGPSAAVVSALADTFFPPAADAPAGSDVVPARLDDLLASLEPADVKELAMAMTLFDMGALPRHGRRFSQLSAPKREAYLGGWMRSRIPLRREIFRQLHNLMKNLYYSDPASWSAVGYDGPPVGKERAS